MRLGLAQLVVRTVCVHNHLGIFEQPQTATTAPMSGHELDTRSIYTRTVAGYRMGYHEYVHGAYYGLKYRAPQKRYLVTVLGLRLLLRRVQLYVYEHVLAGFTTELGTLLHACVCALPCNDLTMIYS